MLYLLYFFIGTGSFVIIFLVFLFYQYNRFVRKKTAIREALENITLFISDKSSVLERIKEYLSGKGLKEVEGIEKVVREGKRINEFKSEPGKTSGISELDVQINEVVSNVRHNIHEHSFPELDLMLESLDKTETQLSGAKRYYNALVKEYNILTEAMPSALVAILLRFPPMDFINGHENQKSK